MEAFPTVAWEPATKCGICRPLTLSRRRVGSSSPPTAKIHLVRVGSSTQQSVDLLGTKTPASKVIINDCFTTPVLGAALCSRRRRLATYPPKQSRIDHRSVEREGKPQPEKETSVMVATSTASHGVIGRALRAVAHGLPQDEQGPLCLYLPRTGPTTCSFRPRPSDTKCIIEADQCVGESN